MTSTNIKISIELFIKIIKKIMETQEINEDLQKTENNDGEFQWIYEKESAKFKQFYSQYPINKWKHYIQDLEIENRFIREGNFYQETVNRVLKQDIFSGEQFIEEHNLYNIFLEFLYAEKIDIEDDLKQKINPDFIVKKFQKKIS